MAEVTTAARRRGPRGNLGAYTMAFLAILIAIFAWVIAANAGNKAANSTKTANHALGIAKDAQTTANNSHPNANTQAAPSGSGTGSNNTVPAGGTVYPNGNGQ